MNLFRRSIQLFLKQPRRTLLRRWLFRIHLYAGLLTGLLLAVVGISGSIVVFKPEIEKSLIAHLSEVAPGTQTVSLQLLYDKIRERRPEDKIINVAMYGGPGAAWNFRIAPASGRRVQVYVNQYTGHILGEDTYDNKFMQWVYDLHADLLGGKTGRTVNGFAGLVLALLALSGVVIWWPGMGRWRQGFTFHRKAARAGKNYDTHKLTGFFSALLLILVALTGAYFPFKEEYHAITQSVTGSSTLESPKLTDPAPHLPMAHLDTVMQRAATAFPEGENILLRFPQKPEENFSLRKYLPGDWSRTGDNFVFMHHYSGEVIRVDYWANLPLGVKCMRAMFPLHFGTFGGLFTRILWVILGIVPAVLFFTGFFIWWNRVVAKKRSRNQKPAKKLLTYSALTKP